MNGWTWFQDLVSAYPFSAHMAQHMLIALVVAPLLLLCVPGPVARKLAASSVLRTLIQGLRHRGFTWLIGIGAMWVWQMPVVRAAMIPHTIQSMCFLITGTIFWWPIVSPLPEERMEPMPWAVLYLSSACLGCTILGILIAFAPTGFFPSHLMPAGSLVISQASDQQIGGLLMWVPGCLIYLSAIMAMFARWYSTPEEETVSVHEMAAGDNSRVELV